jgi:hypothetical protein
MDMAQERIIIQGPDGCQQPCEAEVIRYSTASRVTYANLYIIGGLLAGTVCIVVPIAHLITTWGFPLLGIYMAIRTLRCKIVILPQECTCPACGERMQLTGGSIDDAEWQKCPQCNATLRVSAENSAAVT